MTEPAPATTDSAAAVSELISDPVRDSGLRRLFPRDGLFLRREHLDQMRIYAEEFALVAGVSAGSGVDHGLNVTTDQKVLVVTPGLAVTPSRQPLRLPPPTDTKIPLKLVPDATKLWIIEIVGTDRMPAGQEPIYGSLCDDPADKTPLQPWSDAAVLIRVRPWEHAIAGTAGKVRNQAASAYFADEQSKGKPWLPPPQGAPLVDFPWRTGFPSKPPVQGGAVPIAALLWDGTKWVVDTWIARRDIAGPPSRAATEGHLGLRPWNVFAAQVLQFQAHLADVLKTAGVAPTSAAASTSAQESVRVLSEGLQQLQAKKNATPNIQSECVAAAEQLSAIVGGTSVVAASAFADLPAAGAVPLPRNADPAEYFRTLFDTDLPLEVEDTRADCALRALDQAQHLDRIQLKGSKDYSYVRLLVPTVGEGMERWMVFARGCCPPDEVAVFLHVETGGADDQESPQGNHADSADDLVTTLQYPRGGWAVPGPKGALKLIQDKIHAREVTKVIGYAKSEDRRSLAFVRSLLLVFDLPAFVLPEVPPPAEKESIVIYVHGSITPNE